MKITFDFVNKPNVIQPTVQGFLIKTVITVELVSLGVFEICYLVVFSYLEYLWVKKNLQFDLLGYCVKVQQKTQQ